MYVPYNYNNSRNMYPRPGQTFTPGQVGVPFVQQAQPDYQNDPTQVPTQVVNHQMNQPVNHIPQGQLRQYQQNQIQQLHHQMQPHHPLVIQKHSPSQSFDHLSHFDSLQSQMQQTQPSQLSVHHLQQMQQNQMQVQNAQLQQLQNSQMSHQTQNPQMAQRMQNTQMPQQVQNSQIHQQVQTSQMPHVQNQRLLAQAQQQLQAQQFQAQSHQLHQRNQQLQQQTQHLQNQHKLSRNTPNMAASPHVPSLQQRPITLHQQPQQQDDQRLQQQVQQQKDVQSQQQTTLEQTLTQKKRRGRPKKLILDPSTNLYIDSTHENFKHLNKIMKSASPPSQQRIITGELARLQGQPAYLRTLQDDAVQELLQKKDKRGRPRKFPVEQTGITIKGIRVNGTVKGPRKHKVSATSPDDKIVKRERGRPRKVISNVEQFSTL